MNIFVTSECPLKSAQVLDDKRVVKMVLESAQLLSTALHLNNGEGPYKPTHIYHPCTIWTAASRDNYAWLLTHFLALCTEYNRRFDKTHACYEYRDIFLKGVAQITPGPQTEFINCTPYKDKPVYLAYQLLLNDKWDNDKRPARWYREVR